MMKTFLLREPKPVEPQKFITLDTMADGFLVSGP
jgi:hypothetical protein